jgi:hypothetical protein
MKKILGDKKIFAIGITISKYEPRIEGKSCIWINNSKIGDCDDENILAPFIRSLMRISIKYQELWYEEFEGLECEELFNKVFPFHDNPNDFYDLNAKDQEYYIRYDRFIFEFGENFDNWLLTSIVRKDNCKFIWAYLKESTDDFKTKSIKCFDVPLQYVQGIYRELCRLIPDSNWPTFIKKF